MSCPQCFQGAVHTFAEPKGQIVPNLYGFDTYVSLPAPDTQPKSTIIFYSDAFGLPLVNNKILSDHYAHATGCRVLMPDIIPGGPASLGTMHAMNDVFRPAPSYLSYLNPVLTLGKVWATFKLVAGLGPFLIRANARKAFPVCLKYARDVRKEMPADGKLGVAGFCWGGLPTTLLCAEAVTEGGNQPLIHAQFNAHPSALNAPDDVVDSIEKFKVPYSCAVAELDFQFNTAVAEKTEAAVRQKLGEGVGAYEFITHKDCHHGFAVRASPDEGEHGMRGYNDAAKQAVDWFNKYLN